VDIAIKDWSATRINITIKIPGIIFFMSRYYYINTNQQLDVQAFAFLGFLIYFTP
jgi:hypothetical protein